MLAETFTRYFCLVAAYENTGVSLQWLNFCVVIVTYLLCYSHLIFVLL